MPTFNRRHDLAIDKATAVIAAQCLASGVEVGQVTAGSPMTTEFSLGYVWGVCEGIHQVYDISLSKESFAAIAIVYLNVYGNLLGADSCGRALRLQESPADEFGAGLMLGKREATAFLHGDEKSAPMGLAKYLSAAL